MFEPQATMVVRNSFKACRLNYIDPKLANIYAILRLYSIQRSLYVFSATLEVLNPPRQRDTKRASFEGSYNRYIIN